MTKFGWTFPSYRAGFGIWEIIFATIIQTRWFLKLWKAKRKIYNWFVTTFPKSIFIKVKSWEARRGMFFFLLLLLFLHYLFMIISLLSFLPSILFRFRFIIGWCGCMSHTNCWFPLIDDCWGWLLIDARDL